MSEKDTYRHSDRPVPGYPHRVRRGDRPDTIIEEAYGIEEYDPDAQEAWDTIYNANREIIGDNPQRIAPGQILFIPVAVGKPGRDKIPHSPPTSKPTPGSYYVVKKGETLQAISQQAYGTYEQWEAIYTANKDIIGYHPIYASPGQVLFIPEQEQSQEKCEISHGRDTVFTDTGHSNPQEALAKSKLIMRITTIIEERKLSQREVARLLHIPFLREKIAVFLQRMLRRIGKLFHMPVPGETSSTGDGLWKGYLDNFTLGQLLDSIGALDGKPEIAVHGPLVQFQVATG